MATIKNFDPTEMSIVVAGILMSGFADGTYVRVEFDEDLYSLTVGTDGEACRTKTNNRSATITATLLQSSAVNDLLSALFATDINSSGGDGVGPFLLKDGTGTTLMKAENCWIQKPAAVEYGREATSREWVFRTHELSYYAGGNS